MRRKGTGLLGHGAEHGASPQEGVGLQMSGDIRGPRERPCGPETGSPSLRFPADRIEIVSLT